MLDEPKEQLRRLAKHLPLDLPNPASAPMRLFVESFLDHNLRHKRHTMGKLSPAIARTAVYHKMIDLLKSIAADQISPDDFAKEWKTLKSTDK